jgi:hypothetical protein
MGNKWLRRKSPCGKWIKDGRKSAERILEGRPFVSRPTFAAPAILLHPPSSPTDKPTKVLWLCLENNASLSMLQGKIGTKHLLPSSFSFTFTKEKVCQDCEGCGLDNEGRGRITRIKQNAGRSFPLKLERKHLNTHLSLQLFTSRGKFKDKKWMRIEKSKLEKGKIQVFRWFIRHFASFCQPYRNFNNE